MKVKPAVRKLKWKEERELEEIEPKILALEEEVAELEKTLNTPEFYVDNSDQVPELTRKLESLRVDIQGLYDRWEHLELIKSASSTPQ